MVIQRNTDQILQNAKARTLRTKLEKTLNYRLLPLANLPEFSSLPRPPSDAFLVMFGMKEWKELASEVMFMENTVFQHEARFGMRGRWVCWHQTGVHLPGSAR